MEIRGCRAVVTGASSGIGKQLALDLAREGAKLILLARRADRLVDVRTEIRAAGGEAEVFPCDVADLEAFRRTAERILSGGAVDLLINNAGYGFTGALIGYRPEEIERLTRTNYLGAVYGVLAFAPDMRKRRAGHIVNLASVAGLIAPPYLAAYSASKFAMVAMSRALRYELAPYGVGVTTVCPGVVDTPFFDTHPSLKVTGKYRKGPVLSASQVSRKTIRAIRSNRAQVVLPASLAVMVILTKIIPGLLSLSLSIYAKLTVGLYQKDEVR